MKIVEDTHARCFLSDNDIPAKLDMKVLDIGCPRCRFNLRLPESYATRRTADEVKYMQKGWNHAMDDIVRSCMAVYGEDPRLHRLIGLLELVRKRFLHPELKVIEGGKEGGRS